MSIPAVTFDTIEIHLAADPEFPKIFGKRVRDCGGKFSEIRGMTSTRYVTLPSSETGLMDEILEKFWSRKVTLVLRDFSVAGFGDGRAERAVKKAGQPVFYWSRAEGSPQALPAAR